MYVYVYVCMKVCMNLSGAWLETAPDVRNQLEGRFYVFEHYW